MILAADAGNSNTVFGLFEGRRLVGRWRLPTDTVCSPRDTEIALRALMRLERVGKDPALAVIASVVPYATEPLMRMAGMICRGPVLDAADCLSGVSGMEMSNRGIDRLVNAAGAAELLACSSLVVDLGTATTFDLVDAQGMILGGAIAPGLEVSAAALERRAALLPSTALGPPRDRERIVRKSTASAVRSGTYWGYVYLVEGLVERIKAQTEGALEVCATGGLATLIAPDCKAFDRIEPDLTLLGLRAIAEKYAPMARSGQ